MSSVRTAVRRSRGLSAVALALAGAALMPSPALAAPAPITIGQGTEADVAVGPDGTAYIAYERVNNSVSPSVTNVVYCRLPAGATACASSATLPFPSGGGTDIGALNIYIRAGKVYIFGSESECTSAGSFYDVVEYVSNNTPPSAFNTPSCRNLSTTHMGTHGGFLDANGQFVAAGGSGLGGGQYETTLPAGTGTTATPETQIFPSGPYPELRVGGDTSGHLVVAGYENSGTAPVYSVYDLSAPGTPAQQNTAGNWTQGLGFGGTASAQDIPFVLSGSGGTYLAYIDNSTFTPFLQVLPLVGSGSSARFQAPAAPAAGDTGYGEQPARFAASEANNGDRIATYINNGTNDLRYASATSAHGLAVQGSIANIPGSYLDPEVAANTDQQGVDVWDDGTNVYALPLTPTPDSAPAPAPAPTPTPTPAPTPPKPGPAGPAAPVTVTDTSHQTTLHDSDGSSIVFGTPKACVAPGTTFTVTLGFKKSKRKGAVYVKVTRVEFSIQGSKVKTDKKAPFRQTLTVTASTKKGAKVTVRARAYIKVHHGKTPKKSVHATVSVCS